MAPATRDFEYAPRVTIAEGLAQLARWHDEAGLPA
jgi:hypothetical protein